MIKSRVSNTFYSIFFFCCCLLWFQGLTYIIFVDPEKKIWVYEAGFAGKKNHCLTRAMIHSVHIGVFYFISETSQWNAHNKKQYDNKSKGSMAIWRQNTRNSHRTTMGPTTDEQTGAIFLRLRHYEKHAYSNILKILPPKNENFQIKSSDIFRISAQNIDCGYSLEPPHRRF